MGNLMWSGVQKSKGPEKKPIEKEFNTSGSDISKFYFISKILKT